MHNLDEHKVESSFGGFIFTDLSQKPILLFTTFTFYYIFMVGIFLATAFRCNYILQLRLQIAWFLLLLVEAMQDLNHLHTLGIHRKQTHIFQS